MKNILIVLLVVTSFASYGQKTKLPKKLNQSVVPVMTSTYLMADQYEVTMGDWFAFLHSLYLSGFDSESIGSFFPDREKVPSKLLPALDQFLLQFENEEFSEDYRYGINSQEIFPMPDGDPNIPDLLRFPVSGLSYSQIEEYMLWREDLMNSEKQVIKSGLTARARLLSPEEWDKYASELGPRDVDNATIYPDSMNTHGCYLMNIRYTAPCESTQFLLDQWGEGIFQTGSYFPDFSGLYDLFGNIAEMTSEEGIAKGGSYMHWSSQGTTKTSQNYEGPEKWLGFRVWFSFYEE